MKRITSLAMVLLFFVAMLWGCSKDRAAIEKGKTAGEGIITTGEISRTDYTLSEDGFTLIKWNNSSTKVIDMLSEPYLRNVTQIGANAFLDKTQVTTVILPNGLKTIAEAAFDGCSALTSIVLPKGISRIEDWTFNNCKSLTSISLPNSLTYIGSGAFAGCSALNAISIPYGITHIEDWTFDACTNLTSVTIADSVTQIGIRAFAYCGALTSITIPHSVTEIRDSAFRDSNALSTITIKATKVIAIQENTFGTSVTAIYVPSESLQQYKQGRYWKNLASVILPIE